MNYTSSFNGKFETRTFESGLAFVFVGETILCKIEPMKDNCSLKTFSDGGKSWYQNGKLNRLDGPAVEWSNGDNHWYYEGERINCISQEEFERILKLKALW